VLAFVGTSTNILLRPAYAHALNIKDIEVEGAGNRGVTIVLGHANEPTYGAKPGIHDGKHGVEVFLEDRDTALPITGAQLKVDKYYFKDFAAFKKAKTLQDATETEKNITVGSLFGDPGHYLARQVQKNGIYGYRLYGTIHYFGVAELHVDTTVFCRSPEGSTAKFNSPGWFGGFGCTEDIDDTLFPEKNSDVNPSKSNAKATFEVPSSSVEQGTQVKQVSNDATATPSLLTSIGSLQFMAMVGISAAGLATVAGFRGLKQRRNRQN
jgi:hypothetical protein